MKLRPGSNPIKKFGVNLLKFNCKLDQFNTMRKIVQNYETV